MPKQFEHWVMQPLEAKPKQEQTYGITINFDYLKWEQERRGLERRLESNLRSAGFATARSIRRALGR